MKAILKWKGLASNVSEDENVAAATNNTMEEEEEEEESHVEQSAMDLKVRKVETASVQNRDEVEDAAQLTDDKGAKDSAEPTEEKSSRMAASPASSEENIVIDEDVDVEHSDGGEEEEEDEEEGDNDAKTSGLLTPDNANDTTGAVRECEWCRRPGDCQFQLMGGKSVCSERCLTLCRRAAFKRSKVCEWCKRTIATKDNGGGDSASVPVVKDGENLFCSDKCLTQLKMDAYCRETRAQLVLQHPQLKQLLAVTGLAAVAKASEGTSETNKKDDEGVQQQRQQQQQQSRRASATANSRARTAAAATDGGRRKREEGNKSRRPVVKVKPDYLLKSQLNGGGGAVASSSKTVSAPPLSNRGFKRSLTGNAKHRTSPISEPRSAIANGGSIPSFSPVTPKRSRVGHPHPLEQQQQQQSRSSENNSFPIPPGLLLRPLSRGGGANSDLSIAAAAAAAITLGDPRALFPLAAFAGLPPLTPAPMPPPPLPRPPPPLPPPPQTSPSPQRLPPPPNLFPPNLFSQQSPLVTPPGGSPVILQLPFFVPIPVPIPLIVPVPEDKAGFSLVNADKDKKESSIQSATDLSVRRKSRSKSSSLEQDRHSLSPPAQPPLPPPRLPSATPSESIVGSPPNLVIEDNSTLEQRRRRRALLMDVPSTNVLSKRVKE